MCVCVFPPAEFDVCLIQDYFSSLIFFFFHFFLVKIRKLRRELESAQEKVVTLTTQLSTNVSPRMLLSLHVYLIYVNLFTVSRDLQWQRISCNFLQFVFIAVV